jgi:hypothetical protein
MDNKSITTNNFMKYNQKQSGSGSGISRPTSGLAINEIKIKAGTKLRFFS